MSTASVPFKLTVAGVDAAFVLGVVNLEVTHIQIGDGNATPDGSEVALVSPKEYATIASHFEVTVQQHRIGAIIAGSASAYNISEIGLWSGIPGAPGSVLVFYWSQASGHVAVKSASVDFNFETDMYFGGVVPSNITIVADTQFNALAMLAAHEADLSAHSAAISSLISSISGASKNYRAAATGLNANIGMSADELVVSDGAGKYKTISNFSTTINSAAVGANGLDVGTLAANTWYYKYAIFNPTTLTKAGLLSLSSSAPTLPSGYTFFALLGAIRTDGTGNKYPKGMDWAGNDFKYRVNGAGNVPSLPLLMSGNNGSAITPTWVAAGISNFVPPISSHIDLVTNHQNAQIIVAPNNQFGGNTSTTNPPPYAENTTLSRTTNFRLMLEDVSQIYAAISNIGTYGGINVLGGRVNL